MGSKGEMRWPHSVDVDGDTSLLRRFRDVLVLMAASDQIDRDGPVHLARRQRFGRTQCLLDGERQGRRR